MWIRGINIEFSVSAVDVLKRQATFLALRGYCQMTSIDKGLNFWPLLNEFIPFSVLLP